MIEHVWSVLCHNAAVDAETGSVSLLNILETLIIFGEAKGEVKLPIQYEVFSEWVRADEKQPAKGTMRLFFCNAENECKQQLELPVDLSEHLFARTRVKSNGLVINGPGRYKFLVQLKEDGSERWQPVASLPLVVDFRPESEMNEVSR